MVLLGLVQSFVRLLWSKSKATMVSCGGFREQLTMEVSCSEEQRPIGAAAAAAVAVAAGGGGGERADRSFMGAARLVSRVPSSKRKLDEVDMVETPGVQVLRPRREVREELVQDGSAAESSGRQGSRAEGNDVVAGSPNPSPGTTTTSTTTTSTVPSSPRENSKLSDASFLECLEDPISCAAGDEEQEEEGTERSLSECETNGDCAMETSSSSERESSPETGTETCSMHVDRGSSSSSGCNLQFFVRTYIDGRTIVLHASALDTIESVHQKIFSRTGLPVLEQRLIFGGRQLQHDQSLEECNITNDATLNLVARMRSTALPHSWQLITDLVSTMRELCALTPAAISILGNGLHHRQERVRNGVQDFLKMASKSLPVPEHMQVFQLSGATSALVMLLLSPLESNRTCAEDSINFFLCANEEYLPTSLHCNSAPVLLDFCKLLAKGAPNHNLYYSCRNALARLLDTIDSAHGNQCFNEAKAETIVKEFAPFVNELAVSLLMHLESYAYSSRPDFGAYIKEAKDFTAFVTHFCKAVAVTKIVEPLSCAEASESSSSSAADAAAWQTDSLELTLSCGSFMAAESVDDRQVGSHAWLDFVFLNLLDRVDNCLTCVLRAQEKSQEPGGRTLLGLDDRPFARAPFLFVLKGLHVVAKLSDRSMMRFLSVLQSQRTALNILVRQSRWQEDDFWLLEFKCLLDFESKKRLVMAMLPEPQDDHDERQELVVHRAQLLTESLEQLAYVESDGIQGGLSVEFTSEEATGPGVLREWFFMVCKEIFNPQIALFLPCPNDRRRFYPNPASGVNPGHLTYFKFCGRVLALAMMHRVQIDVTFAISFFKQLAGLQITWEDAKDADPSLHASCKNILDMDAEMLDSDALGLTFVTEVEPLVGSRKVIDLCPGGRDIQVDSRNRRQFVDLLVQHKLVASVTEQVKSFSQGFSDLLVNSTIQQFLRPLELEDLDMILYGKDRDIPLNDWKQHTEYHDYDLSDTQIQWFWQVVEAMPMERRRKLLFFATSIIHLPPEGFSGLPSKFHIHRASTSISWLPTAHTCFYQLILPPYPSLEVMHKSLYAITAEHISEGFGFA